MKTDALAAALAAALGDKASVTTSLGEVTAVIGAAELRATMRSLRDRPELRFELLVDVSGLDYSTYGMAGSGAAQAGSGDDAASRSRGASTAGASPSPTICSPLRTTGGFACACSRRTTIFRWCLQ